MSRLLCALLLSLLAWQASAASLTATVDRARLSEGESLDLILESDDVTVFGKPELEPLAQLFEVISTRQENRLATYDGKTQATTRWIITLMPRQTGFVVIPPLKLGDASSQAITLQVLKGDAQNSGGTLSPIFIDASLDQESVYVQAQAVLTLRIYHSVSLYDDSSLTQLNIPDARVEQLGDPRVYEKTLNGVRHGVIEVRYAIFPQKSGELNIPSQTFSATPAERDSTQDYNPFGPRPGRLTRVKSPQIPLTVKPKPADYPADAPWLPARAISLSEAWTPEPDKASVGNSLTRNVMLRVEGLSSAQLPPLPATTANGLRRYPDQPQLNNEVSERGLIGSREEHEALVPSQSGRIELPELQVVWWNTHEDHLERSSLPARTLQVASNPTLDVETPVDSPAHQALTGEGPLLWPWQLASGLLALTTLLGFGLWWHARRQPAILPTAQSGPSPRTLLDDLKRACQANDSQATRQALDAWARQQPETLADMAARFVPLSEAMDGLNGALYSESGHQWQGESLWKAIRSLPALEAASSPQETSPLPPLYPR
ncbi:BatD family protein [Aquipseudomonas ullengensis]|uniref:Protein BatD n=1 Tax=Aquipseudomonas ullengensis TaxID=2759166 RepID=A0A7W4QB75_9GAMM|nr:BatD family protein [Pseudomonas ullengensis]MBB2496379.1 protein BatD [Pseudomonas ullengensis]